MKTKLLSLLCLLVLHSLNLQAATVDELVAEGRASLAAHNLTNANSSFAAAVTAAPGHEIANTFYSITRLLVLPMRSPLKEFMDRMGFTSTNRNIYQWNTAFARDASGVPLLAGIANLNEASEIVRTHLLTEIAAAEANLAKVTSSSFLLELTAAETALNDVTLDFGDVLVLRSLLEALEYFGYTLHSWNLDAQITSIRPLFNSNGNFSVERLLAEHPQLFTFANPGDLAAAKSAFTNAVALYLRASEFIRNRPPDTERLFNFDTSLTGEESDFRRTLADLRDSLERVVTLRADTNVTVHFARQFDGSSPIRSFFPQFANDAIVLGSLPDTSFGVTVTPLPRSDVEQLLASSKLPFRIKMHPSFERASLSIDGFVRLELNTLAGRSYILQESPNLTNWTDIALSLALSETLPHTVPVVPNQPITFYRAAESSGPANDDFANRVRLEGSKVSVRGSTKNATAEKDESRSLERSVWWTWTAPSDGGILVSVTADFYLGSAIFTGASLATLTPAPDRVTSSVAAGTTYQIAVGSPLQGDFKLSLRHYAPPPNDNFGARLTISGSPGRAIGYNIGATREADEPVHAPGAKGESVWWAWKAPASERYAITTSGSDHNVAFAVYRGSGSLVPVVQAASISAAFDATADTTYYIAVDTEYGPSGNILLNVLLAPRPANDNFADRLELNGTSATATANSLGATKEVGEPDDFFNTGSKSLWWTWTAPAAGAAVISTAGSTFRALIGVYRGTTLSNLEQVTYGFGGLSSAVFGVERGHTYQIAVDSERGAYGDIRLSVTFVPQPANDNFAERITLTGPSPTFSGTTLGATSEISEPKHSFSAQGRSVWWTWTAPTSGPYTLNSNVDDFSLVFAIYTGTQLSNLERVASSDDDEPIFVAVAGASYQIASDVQYRFGTDFTLKLAPVPVVTPVITEQPQARATIAGEDVVLTVVATRPRLLNYQWQKDGVSIPNATNATFTILGTKVSDSGAYRVLVSNAAGSVTSSTAVLTVTPSYIFTTLAGMPGSAGNMDGLGSRARFNGPAHIAVDNAGNVYVAESYHYTIRKITPNREVSTLAGDSSSPGTVDGTGRAARFIALNGVAVDAADNIYVSDYSTIRKITSNRQVSTIAGLQRSDGSADGDGSSARFHFPGELAVDHAGTIYIADGGNHTIRTINRNGIVTTLAGLAESSGITDGNGTSARFNYPTGVAVDESGNIYVADYSNHTIRKILANGEVSTLAGKPGSSGSVDGAGTTARFDRPQSVAADGAGNIYVADGFNGTIRKITRSGDVNTVAGRAGTRGSADGTGAVARFFLPRGLAVDSTGNIYVADWGNHTIRKGALSAQNGIAAAVNIQGQEITLTPAGGQPQKYKFSTEGNNFTLFDSTDNVVGTGTYTYDPVSDTAKLTVTPAGVAASQVINLVFTIVNVGIYAGTYSTIEANGAPIGGMFRAQAAADIPPPPAEVCGDGIDNNKDGRIDEDCPPPPPAEVCGDGLDNNGNGQIDENCPPPGGVPAPASISGKELHLQNLTGVPGQELITLTSDTTFSSDIGATGLYSYAPSGATAALTLRYRDPVEFASDYYELTLTFGISTSGTFAGNQHFGGVDHQTTGNFSLGD
ncbi:MAG: immunoglobulin domain-containing protein [Verrucomicrobiales bacterium]|nr:immunoglobulin domain-containing protein [Verrucomicrobiales bacterium]